MSKFGTGVREPYAHGGLVIMSQELPTQVSVQVSPDEARLLGLRLIKLADEAEAQGW